MSNNKPDTLFFLPLFLSFLICSCCRRLCLLRYHNEIHCKCIKSLEDDVHKCVLKTFDTLEKFIQQQGDGTSSAHARAYLWNHFNGSLFHSLHILFVKLLLLLLNCNVVSFEICRQQHLSTSSRLSWLAHFNFLMNWIVKTHNSEREGELERKARYELQTAKQELKQRYKNPNNAFHRSILAWA